MMAKADPESEDYLTILGRRMEEMRSARWAVR